MNRYLDRIEIGVNGGDCYTYNDLRAGKNQWPFDQPQYLLLSKLATKKRAEWPFFSLQEKARKDYALAPCGVINRK